MKSYRVFYPNKVSSMSPWWHFLGHTSRGVLVSLSFHMVHFTNPMNDWSPVKSIFYFGMYLSICACTCMPVFSLCISTTDVETNLRGEAVAYGGINSIGVSCRAHKAVRVAWEAVTSRWQAVCRTSILWGRWRAEPTLVHWGRGQWLRSVDRTGLLGCCWE